MAICINDLIASLSTDWKDIVEDKIQNYKDTIESALNDEISNGLEFYPKPHNIFKAFDMFNIKDLKVVVVGQDSYHNVAKNGIPLACGLCFSVPNDCLKCPPSLRVIFNELQNEYGKKRTSTDVIDWSRQGVLLLNCALTVQKGKPGSHIKLWKDFTNDMIKYIAVNTTNVVYILWGEFAKSFSMYIKRDNNLVLECRHPSPLAQNKGPFIGNNHFKITNEYLVSVGKTPIEWFPIS
jgi:uracil-DNA glycosylase